ncbi:MAG TPA: MFS transporter [Nakamurella sp.]|nr:MFS transporter [Nakamurella sp.]
MSWAPIGVLGLGVFAIGTDMFVVAGILGQLADDLGVTVGAAALTVTVFAIAYAIGAPLLGAALSVRSPRRVLIGSLTTFVVCAAVSALAPAMMALLAARVLGGVAASVYGPAAAAAAVAAHQTSRRGRALGVLQGASSMAMIAGAPLGLMLATALSWRAAFGLVAVIAAIAVIGLLGTGFASAPPARFTVRERLRPVWSPAVLGSLGVTFLVMAASNSVFSYLSVLLGDGTDLGGLWLFIAAFGVGGVAGTWWGGTVADRWGGARVTLIAGILLTAAVASLPFAASPAVTLAVLVGWGFAGWGFIPGQQHRLLELGPGPPSFLLALNSSAVQLGFAVGALLGGPVVDTAGAGILAVACGVAGLVLHGLVSIIAREIRS